MKMLRVWSEADGVTRSLPMVLPPEDKKTLDNITKRWPPTVDGYLFVSQQEVDAVVELRKLLKDIEHDCRWRSLDVDDIRILLCFVRARKLNVKAAAQMWRNAYAWRKQHEPERVVPGYVLPSVLEQYSTGGPFGFDREGSPVFVDRLGHIDPAGILRHITVDEMLECEWSRLEYLQLLVDSCCIRDNKPHWGITIIMDLSGLGIHHLNTSGLQAFKRIVHQSDNNYPERAKRVLVINAPYIFTTIWKIVQHFLDPVTREKVQIYHDGASEHLLKYIAPEHLPEFLGGKARNGNGDPDCCPPIRKGGRVPKDFREPQFEDSVASNE